MMRQLLSKIRFPTLSKLTDFSFLAKVSTSRVTTKGVLPEIGTIASLAAVSAVIATGAWLWVGFLSTSVSFLPILITSIAAVTGLTFLNFLFAREINYALLSAREVCPGMKMDEFNPTELLNLVAHVTCEVNQHLRTQYPNYKDIDPPLICTFTDTHIKIVTVEGRDADVSAIYISTGCLNSKNTHFNQRDLAALLAFEIFKIARHRGVTRTLVQMWTDFLRTFETVRYTSYMGSLFNYLVGPLQFFLLFQRSISRSYEYTAAKDVFDIGRGMDLVDGIDKKVNPNMYTGPTYFELQKNKNNRKRQDPKYQGRFFKNAINAIEDWIDKNELSGANKKESRFISFFQILVRELLLFTNELWAEKPRSTRLKDYLREPELLNLGDKTQQDLPGLRQKDREKNQRFYENIPANKRYRPISPQATGDVSHERTDHKEDRAVKQRTLAEVEPTKARVVVLEAEARERQETIQQQQVIITELRNALTELRNGLQQNRTEVEAYRTQLTAFTLHNNGHGNGHNNGHSNGHNGNGSAPSSPKKMVGERRPADAMRTTAPGETVRSMISAEGSSDVVVTGEAQAVTPPTTRTPAAQI